MRGIHDPYGEPIVPKRREVEGTEAFVRRILEENGIPLPEGPSVRRVVKASKSIEERIDDIIKGLPAAEPPVTIKLEREPGQDD